MKAFASSAERRSGLDTISISATPERLRSTNDSIGCTSCSDVPASCSRWRRSMTSRRRPPSPTAPLMYLPPLLTSMASPRTPRALAIARRRQQRRDDLAPFLLQRAGMSGAPGLPVPIACIAKIALDAVQVGVNPGRVLALLVLHDLVRARPVSLGGPPQTIERGAKSVERSALR